MAIDDSGDRWTATESSDVPVYLAELTRWGDGFAYPATEFRQVRCGCGSERFRLARAREVTQRTCAACGQVGYISRGTGAAAAWEEAIHDERPEPYRCAGCGGDESNVSIGFALLPGGAVKWFYIGNRCCNCGVLNSFNNGKVGRSPAAEVFPEVTGEADLAAEPPKGRRKAAKKPPPKKKKRG